MPKFPFFLKQRKIRFFCEVIYRSVHLYSLIGVCIHLRRVHGCVKLKGVVSGPPIDRVGSITFKMYFNYKIQITFFFNNSNTFFNYFG